MSSPPSNRVSSPVGLVAVLAASAALLALPGCGRSYVWGLVDDDAGPGKQEICDNNLDDDGDGFVDCQDTDCRGFPGCSAQKELCGNGLDDDRDGLVDCNDPDCFGDPGCKTQQEICDNGRDDDGDGLIDCQDPQCFAHPACQTKKEVCDNGVDDDKDGFVDCQDPDCKSHPSCQAKKEQCTNGVDDDGDGLTDCNDPDCFSDPNCKINTEICNNGIDDDFDGLVDCQDPQCFNEPYCKPIKEICNNGKDDDGDGYTDCADSDCKGDPVCLTKPEICDNGIDDDGDGLIDCKDQDCLKHPKCGGPGKELCQNGVDDDADKLVDCDDPDCKSDPACQVKQEVCNNKQDDDGDGLVDCDDPDCIKHPDCKTPGTEVCNNGVDDDGDGKVDCDDPDCASWPFCKPGKENCTNNKDDDGDGAVDCNDPDCKNHPACQSTLCKPSVSFGTLKPKGSSVTRTLDTKGNSDIYQTTCVIPGGGEVVATFTLSDQADVKLEYEQQSGDSVYGLYRAGVGEACNANHVACYDPKSSKKGSFSIKALAKGTYYLFAEAFAKTLEGQSKVTLSTGQTTSKEICDNGIDDDKDGATDCADLECTFHASCANKLCKVDVNLGSLVVNGPGKTATVQTHTGQNNFDLVCSSGGGRERVIQFAMPSSAVLGVTVQQQGWHAFGLHRSQGPGTQCTADKGSCMQKQWPGIVIDYGTNEKGTYYYVVEEMKAGQGGQVSVTFKAYANRGPELCTNGIDDDGDGLIDCMDPDCTGVVGCPGPVCVPDKKTGPLAPYGGGVSLTVDTKTANNDQTVPCALGGGKDVVIEVKLTQVSQLKVSCTDSGDHVLGLFQEGQPRDPCDKNKLSCADPKTGPIGCNFYWGNMQPGTYYLVVEAFKPGSEGTFHINLRAEPDKIQEICNNGKDDDGDGKVDCQDYNCATTPYCQGKTCTPDQKLGVLPTGTVKNVALTVKGAGDSHNTSCSKGGGEDYVVGFTLSKQSNLRIDWAQFGNHVLGLFSDKGTGYSCDAAPLKCVPTGGKISGTTNIANLPSGQYFLVLDALAAGQEGSVVLNLTAK